MFYGQQIRESLTRVHESYSYDDDASKCQDKSKYNSNANNVTNFTYTIMSVPVHVRNYTIRSAALDEYKLPLLMMVAKVKYTQHVRMTRTLSGQNTVTH